MFISPQKHTLWLLIRKATLDTYDEYIQHRFHGETKLVILWKKTPYLDLQQKALFQLVLLFLPFQPCKA